MGMRTLAYLAGLVALLLLPGEALAQISFRAATQASSQLLTPRAPYFEAAGGAVNGTGNVSPAWPTHAVDDVALLFCEAQGDQPIALGTPAGFVEVTGSPQATGADTKLAVFWARATSTTMGTPTVTDPGNHVHCQILTYRNVITTGDPWNVTGGGVKATASTSVTVTGVTTTVDAALVVQAISRQNDAGGAAFSAQANANLNGLLERVDDGTNSGNGGGISVTDGVMVAAGATGDTTATVTNSINAFLTIALVQPPVPPLAPVFQAAGAASGGAGAVTPAWPTHEVSDVGLLICESAGAETPAAPAGWTAVTNGIQATGDATTGTTLSVFWARATSAAMATPTVADVGNHLFCQILTYRGVVTSGNPWDVTAGGVKSTASTAFSATGVTTTTNNTLIVQAVSRENDAGGAGFSAQANGNLTALAERADGGTSFGNGGGIAVTDGVLATAGATGTTTGTVTNSVNAFVTIALLPEGAGPKLGVPVGTLAGDLMIAAIAVRPSTTTITAPAGWTALTATVQSTADTSRQQIFYRFADTGDVAGGVSYVWTFGASSRGIAGGIVSYSGVDAVSASPIDVSGGNTTPVSGDLTTEHRATSITTTVPNTMVISSHSFASSELFTAPALMTSRVNIFSESVAGVNGISLQVNEVPQSAAGATGNKTATVVDVDRGVAQLLALRPAYTHYGISYTTANVATCEPARVVIQAHHAGDGLAAPAAGTTLTLNTSSGTGVWQSPAVVGTGVWTPSGANNGIATYVWSGAEAVLEVNLRHNTPVTLGTNLTDTQSKVEGGGTEDPSLTFADSVLRVTGDGSSAATVGTQIAAKRSDTGAGAQTLRVQAVATSPASGACTTLFRNQNVTVEFAAQCNNPATCSGVAGTEFGVLDNASSFVAVAKNNGPGAPGTYTGVTLAFSDDTNAMAPLVVRYGDAGQVTLHMRYALPTPPSTTISGTSNAFVVRPFGFAFRGADALTSIQHSNTAAGTLLAAAGDNFTMTVGAYKWATGQDTVVAGTPDAGANIVANGLTPNFAASTSVSAASNLPGVATGALSRGVGCASAATIAVGSWSGGSATIADWCYSEVGNVQLSATADDYLAASDADISGNSGLDGNAISQVGRFRPKHFALSSGVLTNRAATACAGSFSYMSERLDLAFTLTAQNTQNGTALNYNGLYAKLDVATIANLNLGARGTTDLTTRLALTSSAGSWTNGVASVTARTGILRAASPDGPITGIQFGVAPTDSDGAAMNTLDLDVDGAGGADHKDLGVSTEVRFGRLRMQNALASSGAITLPVQMEIQYWNGTLFERNSGDSCTTLAATNVGQSDPRLNLAIGESTATPATITFTGGRGNLVMSAPGTANNGSVLLTPDLSAGTPNLLYLQGAWTGATYDQNPAARASWGVFGSQPRNFIFQRENY